MVSPPAAKNAAMTRWPVVALAAIVIASLAFRVYVSNHCSLWLDEVWTVHDTEVSWLDLLRGASREHPPLMYWFVRASMALFGTSELALRVPSLLFGCGLLVAVYFLCLELELRPPGALVVVAWLAISPFFVRHATEARHYAMFPALTVLATLFTLRLLRRPDDFGAFVGFAVSAAAAAATQYFGLAYAAALLGVLAWQRFFSWRRGEFSWRISRRVAVVGGLCAAVYLIIVVQAFGLAHFYAHHRIGPRTGRLDLGLLSEFSFLHQSPLATKIEPFVAAAGLVILGVRLRGIARVVPFALAFAPCAAVFLISSGHRVMPRYVAPSFVFYQLGAAVFVVELAGFIAGHASGFAVWRVLRALPAALVLLLPFVVRLREYPAGYGAGLDFYTGLQNYLKWHDDTALVVYPKFPGEFIVRNGYPVNVPLQTLEDFKPIPGVHHYLVAEFERPSMRRDFGDELAHHFGMSRRRLRALRPLPLPRTQFQPAVHARLLTIDD
jgi:hypothetical protein